jgi:site-specific DNA recombinase
VNGRRLKAKPIITEDVHDRLLDNETFKRVQAKLAERSQKNQRPHLNNYILSGILRCGHCGGAMVGRVCRNRKGERRYYMCSIGQTRPGACQCYQIPASVIEDYVLGQINLRLLTDDAIDAIKTAIYRQARARSTYHKETKSLQAKIGTLDTKIARGTENLLLAAPRDVADMSALLASWREERDKLHEELERMASSPGGRTPEQLAEVAIGKLQSLRKQLETADPMRVRAVVKSVVAEVQLWFEPYGKRSKRFTRGLLEWCDELQVFSRGSRGR